MKSERRPPEPSSGSPPHCIRLRGPWQYEVRERFESPAGVDATPDEQPGSGQIRLPADWGSTLGHNFTGRVCFTRRFHRPTGLEQGERVALVVERVDAVGTCSLNGKLLGRVSLTESLRMDVTSLLEQQNLLKIEVECPARDADGQLLPRGSRQRLAGGLIGGVRLEIDQAQ